MKILKVSIKIEIVKSPDLMDLARLMGECARVVSTFGHPAISDSIPSVFGTEACHHTHYCV